MRCRMFANHGGLVKNEHQMEGVNSRLDSIQAAMLTVKLNYAKEWIKKRISHARYYSKLLATCPEVSVPYIRTDTEHTFHLYVIKTRERDKLKEYLEKRGIQTAIHYPVALPFLPAYEYLGYHENDFPVASQCTREILSLPLFPELTDRQLEYVCQHIQSFYNVGL
jgi:dTDP-4-amino-4,6-dideoxygalactose transaminase